MPGLRGKPGGETDEGSAVLDVESGEAREDWFVIGDAHARFRCSTGVVASLKSKAVTNRKHSDDSREIVVIGNRLPCQSMNAGDNIPKTGKLMTPQA